MTLISFLLFTGLVAWLTWRITRNDDHSSTGGYFLAGRSLSAPLIAGSLLLTNLSTEQMVGLNGAAFTDGLCVMVWEVVCVLALVFMAWFFLPRFLRSGVSTVPEYLAIRFDSGTQLIANIIFLLAYVGILLPIILYTGATGMMGILDVPAMVQEFTEDVPTMADSSEEANIATADNAATADSTVTTDSAAAKAGETARQRARTISLWLIVIVVGLIGSVYALFGGLRTVAVSDTLNGIGLFAGGFMITAFALTQLGGGEGIQAEAIQNGLNTVWEQQAERFNSVGSNDSSVPFGTIFSGIFLLNLFYWTTNQQIIQRTFGASSLAEGQKGVLLTGALKLLGPLYLVLPGMIAWSMFADTGIKPDQAYGALVNRVLPDWLNGFFAAVMIGAILSSFNSALNSACTLFSLGLYRNVLQPNATEAQVVRSGKAFGWVVAVLSMGIAPLLEGQESIFGYLQKMNGMYFIPIFAVVLVGMLSRRVPPLAARIGLLGGITLISLGYFVPPFSSIAGSMHDFHFLGLVFAWLVIIMMVIGEVAPRDTEFVQEDVHAVDMTPWGLVRPAGFALIALIITIYATFADFSVLVPKEPAVADAATVVEVELPLNQEGTVSE